MKKILIVDDSLVYRHALNSAISENKKYIVVGAVKNGQEAIEFIARNHVDLMTLDIEMPVMNGFELIEKVSKFPSKPKIIVFTSLDQMGADYALRALKLGADDFLTKIEGSGDIAKNILEVKNVLLPKLDALLEKNNISQQISSSTSTGFQNERKMTQLGNDYEYIFIGSSTGGPEALRLIFKELRGLKLPPIFIVQHMPPIYTKYLANSLDEFTDYKVIEAKNGDVIKSGHCYIAPGDYHMNIIKKNDNQNVIQLNQEEKDCFVRPSVNQLFKSSKSLSYEALYVILTGMGSDGLEGVKALYEENKELKVLIQDEKSSVVFGMPGEIYKANLYSEIKNLSEIKEYLSNIIK